MKKIILTILSLVATPVLADAESDAEQQRQLYYRAKSSCRVEAQQAAGPRPMMPQSQGGFAGGVARGQWINDVANWKRTKREVFDECMAGEGF